MRNHSIKASIPTMLTIASVVQVPNTRHQTTAGYRTSKEAVRKSISLALLKIIIRICVVVIEIQ